MIQKPEEKSALEIARETAKKAQARVRELETKLAIEELSIMKKAIATLDEKTRATIQKAIDDLKKENK